MSKKKSLEDDDNKLDLNHLTLPFYISHVKPGNTLSANDNSFLLQDGSTTIELRTSPKFESKKIQWRYGLIRDIVWCPTLNVFILLTQKSLFTFNPQSIVAPLITGRNTNIQLKITSYSKIKPYDEKYSFWRCTCIGTTLYISYSGFGTIIDEYIIRPSSCELINRWIPPKTCANYEGIWCIRYHPNTGQIGMTVMNERNNQWRFELRNRMNFSIIWQTVLPVTYGDCELSPLTNGEWLAVNSCGIRLIQIVNRKLKAAVEYERELRNAIPLRNDYFLVRTKDTIEIHSNKKN